MGTVIILPHTIAQNFASEKSKSREINYNQDHFSNVNNKQSVSIF